MKLSIIIVTWNVGAILTLCLESVERNLQYLGVHNVETIVVDNASTDNTVEIVRECFPWVCLICNNENIGFARANNQAIALCRGENVLLLNPDTKLHAESLRILLTYLDENPDVGAVGPRLLNSDGSLQQSCYPAPTLVRECGRLFHFDSLYPIGTYRMSTWSVQQPREVEVIQGACMLTRSTVLRQAGLFDETYFMYTEEVDLCLRIRQRGWRICWVPQAEVVHYGGHSAQQASAEMFLQLYRSKVLYFRKHYGYWGAATYKVLLFVAGLMRLLVHRVAAHQISQRHYRHASLAVNYRCLLTNLPSM